MVHCSLDLREVIENSTPDVLYCEKVKKTAAAAATPETQTPPAPGKIDGGSHFGMSPPAKKPAAEDTPAKKLKKPSKKIKLNTTDCLANDII